MVSIYKENPSKKYVFVMFTLLLSSILAIGNVDAFQLKYYGSHYEEPYHLDGMDGVPCYYFDGVKAIRVYENSNRYYLGMYFTGGIINLYGNYSQETLIHELAHHCQFIRHDTVYNMITHKGLFNSCYEEIFNESTT